MQISNEDNMLVNKHDLVVLNNVGQTSKDKNFLAKLKKDMAMKINKTKAEEELIVQVQ